MINSKFLETANKWKNDEIPILRESSKSNNLENVLIFCSKNEIYVLDNNGLIEKIGERRGGWGVNKFCLNDGKIYDASGDSIFETLKDKEVVSRRDGHNIDSLCSYNNILYDATRLGINESLKSEEIVPLRSTAHLCLHNKNLYYTDGEEIFVLGKDTVIADRDDEDIQDLVVHNGILCDVTNSQICNTFTNKVLIKNTLAIWRAYSYKGRLYYNDGLGIFKYPETKEIFQGEDYLYKCSNLCFHNGKLYGFGYDDPLVELETNKVIFNKEGIYAAESFPRKLFVDAGVLR